MIGLRVRTHTWRLGIGMLSALGALSGTVAAQPPAGPSFGPPPVARPSVPATGQLPPPQVAPPTRPPQPPPAAGAEAVPAGKPAAPAAPNVADVRLDGIPAQRLEAVTKHVAQQVRTRRGRPFLPEQVEEDVRRLIATRRYIDVDTFFQPTADGQIIVIFKLVERPTIEYVQYIGNTIRSSVLAKKSGLKEGMAKDPYSVDEGRRKIEEFYQEKGYSRVRVTVIEGTRPEDRGVKFLINEGGKQKIWQTKFEGNTIVSDGRLKTQIQSKPGILWIFKGKANADEIKEDENRLEAYYRSLGFFNARVGSIPDYDEEGKWLTLTFVIDEGPRYRVRNVSIVGNTKFTEKDLAQDFKLVPGDYFDQKKMNRDVADLQDKYGSQGYVFAAVEATPTFNDEQQGILDLVYRLDEGERYRVGRIDPIIKGENPHTRLTTVLNRMSIRPGDIMDLRELRNSERRLKYSGLFVVDPSQGEPPKVVFKEPDADDSMVAEKPKDPDNFRGQSPDAEGPRGVVYLFSPSVRGLRQPVQAPQPQRQAPPPQLRGPNDRLPPVNGQVRVRGQSPDGSVPWGQQPKKPSGAPLVAQRPITNNNAPSYPATWRGTNQPVYVAQGTAGGAPYGAPAAPQYQAAPNPYPTTPGYQPQPTVAPPPNNFAGTNPYAAPPVAGYPATGAAGFGAPPGGAPAFGAPNGAEVVPPGGDNAAIYPQEGMPFLGTGDPTAMPPVPTTLEPLDLWPTVEETQTGRLMFGVGINSNAGVVGNIVIDERNFDLFRIPKSWEEVRNFSGFRGGGQQLRIEAVPGNQLQRYMITFREPYLFNTPISFGTSGFLFTRQYFGWSEERIGGKVSLGYQFPYRPDLSTTLSIGGQNVEVKDPRFPTPESVLEVLGNNALYTARLSLAHDTRDSAFLATEGHLWEIAYEQAFGDFNYPRGTLEVKQYFHTMERADGSGRHVLSFTGQVGISGDDTPVFENFYAGGFSTIRGFDFRGASPRQYNVAIGGRFQLLGSAEYMVPITPDDMLRAVVFCDTGTVEEDIDVNADNFRVAPGVGLRITVPALGPAPIALDLAVPVAHAGGDDIQNFAFFMGFSR